MPRILVIDDDEDICSVLETALASLGHTVLTATDGKEGMLRHRATPADLIITDMFMPNQEGVETIRLLRKEFPTLPIIAMSGRSSADVMLTVARRLGVVDVLQKPFTVTELIASVDRALRPEPRSA